LRATPECAQLTEWFAPGTEPTRTDDWERGGRVNLPVEYAEWSHQGPTPVATELALRPWSRAKPSTDSASAHHAAEFKMVSPQDGDRYGIPAGVDARYATIPLRAGGHGAHHVRWNIDGRAFTGTRWALMPGNHIVRATSASGETVEAHITVER
jgi:hypothetical protein